MVDKERIKNAKQILTTIKPNGFYNIAFENDKLVICKAMPPITNAHITIFAFLFLMGLFVKLYFLMILSLIGIGYIVYTEFLFTNYLVIDYNNDVFYLDKRRNGNSISKKTICYFRDIAAVGVNNNFTNSTRADKPEEENAYIEQSAVAFLKKDGTMVYYNDFIKSSKSYNNNCLLSDAISELFNIPKLNCSKNKQLKVVKEGSNYKLMEVPLETPSLLVNLIKLFAIVVSILAIAFYILELNII